MIAYKGFNRDLTCTLGAGTYQYVPGKTVDEERSNCARRGLHCTEYPLECFGWYSPLAGSRYYQVEAEGSIDECGGDAKIACTRMTLIKELNVFQMAAAGMMYMVKHPLREWELQGYGYEIARDRACASQKGAVAIARGPRPRVKGAAGTYLGLLVEALDGTILEAKAFRVGGRIRPDTWYTLEGREVGEEREEDREA